MNFTVPTLSTVAAVRSASRIVVRELGFLNGSVSGTDLPPSSVHALIEIEKGEILASDLCERLRLDKSSVSRMLRKLVRAGLVEERPDPTDGRAKALVLTSTGVQCVSEIHVFAQGQVGDALSHLPADKQLIVQEGLTLYAQALTGRGSSSKRRMTPVLREGYRPGLIARITELHADYYAREHGLGQVFESRVAAGLSEFCDRIGKPGNGIWTAEVGGTIYGSIAIDGEDLGDRKAHLRWFIVDGTLRGSGAGRALLDSALAFVDRQDFTETHLDTFSGLDAARCLYEAAGFQLVQEAPGTQWGKEVLEQRFVRVQP